MPGASHSPIRSSRFIFFGLDPIHVGTGGYRLGRVDLPIAREPASRLPKIPGTSLSGMARAHAALLEDGDYATTCAGLNKYCGQCAVCHTFGSDRGDKGAHAGMVSIFDAQILLFPVYSIAGPVWVTTDQILEAAGFADVPGPGEETACFTAPVWNSRPLNLGWMFLDCRRADAPAPPASLAGRSEWATVKSRLVIVSDRLFSHIVQSNLEVRTSVVIDPATGAATDKKLFTYEAIPRAAFLSCEVVQDFYLGDMGDCHGHNDWNEPMDVVRAGFRLAEQLGVGGMGTRGFGRFRVIAEDALAQPLAPRAVGGDHD